MDGRAPIAVIPAPWCATPVLSCCAVVVRLIVGSLHVHVPRQVPGAGDPAARVHLLPRLHRSRRHGRRRRVLPGGLGWFHRGSHGAASCMMVGGSGDQHTTTGTPGPAGVGGHRQSTSKHRRLQWARARVRLCSACLGIIYLTVCVLAPICAVAQAVERSLERLGDADHAVIPHIGLALTPGGTVLDAINRFGLLNHTQFAVPGACLVQSRRYRGPRTSLCPSPPPSPSNSPNPIPYAHTRHPISVVTQWPTQCTAVSDTLHPTPVPRRRSVGASTSPSPSWPPGCRRSASRRSSGSATSSTATGTTTARPRS